MRLDLVRSRRDLRRLQQILSRLDREVANTDTPNLASCNELLQNSPSISDRHIGYLKALRDRIGRRESLVGVGKGDGPVDLRQVGQSINCLIIGFWRANYDLPGRDPDNWSGGLRESC